MAANVETMFYTREKPWHGLGTKVESAPDSYHALIYAGLDWEVVQKSVYTGDGISLPGYRANVRSTDDAVLGVVTDKYKVIQNREAFAFTDELLGEGVRYETAGSLQGGKRVWLLARMPRSFVICGDRIDPYLVFTNTHDGSGAVRVACTPIRVVCNNTLNLALSSASRSWSMVHTGDVRGKIKEARDTLFHAEDYMVHLGQEIERMSEQKMTDNQVEEMVSILLPFDAAATERQKKTVMQQRDDLMCRYFDAPDLKRLNGNAYRFINAVSDYATHAEPIRRTKAFGENRFARSIDGSPLIDAAYRMVAA